MYGLLILFLASSVVYLIWSLVNTDKWLYDGKLPIWVHILISLVLVLLSLFGLRQANYHIEQYSYNIDIYSGYNDFQTNGQFFLGSGTINEKDYVYFWVEDKGGVLRKFSYCMNISSFVEDGGNYVIVTESRCDPEWKWLCGGYGEILKSAEFHIPEGSIYNMYRFQ